MNEKPSLVKPPRFSVATWEKSEAWPCLKRGDCMDWWWSSFSHASATQTTPLTPVYQAMDVHLGPEFQGWEQPQLWVSHPGNQALEQPSPKSMGVAGAGLGCEPMCSKGGRGLNWELSCGDHGARARRDIFGAPQGQPGAAAFLCTEPWAGLHRLSACPIIQHTALIPSTLQGSSSLCHCAMAPLKIECVLKKVGSTYESNSPYSNRNVSGRCPYCLIFFPLLQKEPRWSF